MLLDNNKKQNQKMKSKHSLKDCIEEFFFYIEILYFLLHYIMQNNTLNEVLNNYGLKRQLSEKYSCP